MISRFLILVLVAFYTQVSAQIKEFYITCDPANFQLIYDNYEEDIYIPATFAYNGTTWSDVSIRIRGDGSRVYPKKSLKVRFNTDPFADGRTALNLNAEWEDKSYIQQVLASRLIAESNQHCFAAEHVRFYLNGAFFGLYVVVEAVDERFLETRGMNPEGWTYKASLDGSSLSVFDDPHFHWEQKTGSNLNMADLQSLINGINNTPQNSYESFVDETFNRSEMVNLISMNILLSLGSTYYHNYFMHHDPATDKWTMLPWDMDKTLLYYGSGFPYDRSSSPWAPDNPYHEKAIQSDVILAEIRARMVELQSGIFNTAYVQPIIDSIQAVISASVSEDVTDDVSDLTVWQNEISNYQSTLGQRVANALNQIDSDARTFTVERVGSAEPGASISVSWTPSVSPLNRPISYRFRFGNDLGMAGPDAFVIDNISETEVQFTAPTTEGSYYYRVDSYDGFSYTEGFDTYNPIVVTSEIPALVINEINYNSDTTIATADWVEIHNPLTYSVNLDGWELKDNQFDHSYFFNSGDEVAAGGYMIVCRDTLAFQTYYPDVTNVKGDMVFGFGNGGDAVRLVHPSTIMVDEVIYMDTIPWPILADGYGPTLELNSPELDNSLPENWSAWENRRGTPGAQNFRETGILETEHFGFKIYPNPTSGNLIYVAINSAVSDDTSIVIRDMLGKTIKQFAVRLQSGQSVIPVEINQKSSGVYFLSIQSSSYQSSSKFILNRD
ncbi:CotH kinase family protein [Flavobacteriales bacterium]|nr:CotH kinase family protein [Flavobacteriales bacterium]